MDIARSGISIIVIAHSFIRKLNIPVSLPPASSMHHPGFARWAQNPARSQPALPIRLLRPRKPAHFPSRNDRGELLAPPCRVWEASQRALPPEEDCWRNGVEDRHTETHTNCQVKIKKRQFKCNLFKVWFQWPCLKHAINFLVFLFTGTSQSRSYWKCCRVKACHLGQPRRIMSERGDSPMLRWPSTNWRVCLSKKTRRCYNSERCVCVFVYVYVCHWQRRNNMQSSITMCAGESLCAYPDVNVFTSECIISRQSPWLLPVLSVHFIPVSPLTFLFSLLLLV